MSDTQTAPIAPEESPMEIGADIQLPEFVEFRLRTQVPQEELELKKGRLLKPSDVNIMLTGPTRVLLPRGQPLCVYWPGAIPEALRTLAYPALHSLRSVTTDNRSYAAASPGRFQQGKRSYGMVDVASALVGAFEGNTDGGRSFCRLTAWTGKNWPAYETTWPLLQRISECFAAAVPDRYAVQMQYVHKTQPDWIVRGTPFTTLTVNNTYPTGVHTDKGDLEVGYSTLCVLRRNIRGGALCFPEWRVGVELHDGDLLLMDAHHWHGNLPLETGPPSLDGDLYETDPVKAPGIPSERISLVAYYRTKISQCGTAEEEGAKAVAWTEKRAARGHEDTKIVGKEAEKENTA